MKGDKGYGHKKESKVVWESRTLGGVLEGAVLKVEQSQQPH